MDKSSGGTKTLSAIDLSRHDWSILTKTRKGEISYLRGLTLAEAKQIFQRLDPFYGRLDDEVVYGDDSDVVLRVVFGPEGWDSDNQLSWDIN